MIRSIPKYLHVHLRNKSSNANSRFMNFMKNKSNATSKNSNKFEVPHIVMEMKPNSEDSDTYKSIQLDRYVNFSK